MGVPVVYEDDWLLVVDKPAGLLTIPTAKNESRTLTSILNENLKAKNLSWRLHPCHRLDRETSGLIIYAKGKSAQKKMMRLFKKRKIKKTYVAFVQGALKENYGSIKSPIDGESAVTKYRVSAKRRNFSIVEIMPLSGRKNQIRIHFKSIGHPLVGERRFAFRKDYPLRAKRACLHALRLEFVHPVTKKSLLIEAQLPQDLRDFLRAHPD